tara:strand:+ start:365 stop:640 length:276 start_codon:yes stop_codon:yes gene_type:complete
MREYKKIIGFEGPLRFKDRTLYWDKKEGQYYDPDTDLYLSQQQADNLSRTFGDIIAHAELLGWQDNHDDFNAFFTLEYEKEISSYINKHTK